MTDPERYHLTLTVDGRLAVQGWWRRESTARGKLTEWIGAWGRPGCRIVLVDEETGTVLTTWPSGT